jgi:predicted nucleic acid-binding protein
LFRSGDARLEALLEEGSVVTHDFVIGELACGNLRHRGDTLKWLAALPRAPRASESEVHALLEAWKLQGRGLGWIDLHLIAAAQLGGVELYTRDRRLRDAL